MSTVVVSTTSVTETYVTSPSGPTFISPLDISCPVPDGSVGLCGSWKVEQSTDGTTWEELPQEVLTTAYTLHDFTDDFRSFRLWNSGGALGSWTDPLHFRVTVYLQYMTIS